MRSLLAAGLLLLAGCLGTDDGSGDGGPPPSPPSVPDDWAARAVPFGQGHDHTNVEHHRNLSTPNFELVGWDPLITDYHGATSGTYFCGDVAPPGERTIAVTHSFSTDVALVVLDVTDPATPRKLGELSLPNTHVYDVAMTPDARFAVLATSPAGTGPDPGATMPVRAVWTDACGRHHEGPEQEVPFKSGVVLVDISTPESPAIADFAPQPVFGAHSIFATEIDGTSYVLASTTNLAHGVSYFTFFTIEEIPVVGPRLATYGTFSASYPDPETNTPLTNGHVDGWIARHPLTNDLLAFLADWNGGLYIVRMDGPGQLTPVGHWSDYSMDAGASMTGQIHEALPMAEAWGGVHYTIIGQEVGGRPQKRPTGQVIVLDTTDPSTPTPVARWTLPVDVEFDAGLQFSTHYVEVVGRTLFVALYHGGVWAVRLDPQAGPELATVGVFIPDRASPNPPPSNLALYARWTPVVLDVLALPNGDLLTFDGMSGAYVVRFDPNVTVPAPTPWTEDSWIQP